MYSFLDSRNDHKSEKAGSNLRFSRAAKTYDRAAFIHKKVAQHLLQIIDRCVTDKRIAIPKNILDVGSGTGIFANIIQNSFSDINVTLMDVSADMLNIAIQKYSDKFGYIVADAKHFEEFHKYDMIVSTMAMQWFSDVKEFLLSVALENQTIAFAMPIFGTFSEWYKLLESFDIQVKHPEYKTHEDMMKICADVASIKHATVREYSKKFQSPLECARYISSLGANIYDITNSLNSMKKIFQSQHKPTLCYRVFFAVLAH